MTIIVKRIIGEIILIESRPSWIHPIIEAAAFDFKFIREDELVSSTIFIGQRRRFVVVQGCIRINPARLAYDEQETRH